MIYEEETFDLNGKTITLRSPKKEDSKMLLDWLKTVCDETPFLLQYGDEVKLTIDQEEAFIETRNTSDSGLMILAFVDGEFADPEFLGKQGFRGKFAFRRIHSRVQPFHQFLINHPRPVHISNPPAIHFPGSQYITAF